MMVSEIDTPGGRVRIGVVGSCRVHDPLRYLVAASGGRHIWYRDNAFVHSPPEVSQYLNFCRAVEPVPPPNLSKYIFSNPGKSFHDPDLHVVADTCDTYIVEISDIRHLSFEGISLQSNYFEEFFVRGGGLGVLKWWRAVLNDGDRAATIPGALDDLQRAGRPITPLVRGLLEGVSFRKLTEDAFSKHLQAIPFAPERRWIFVPHFDMQVLHPAERATRQELSAWVRRAAAAGGWESFDYSPVLAAYDPAYVLAGAAADHFHLNGAFLPELWPVYQQLLAGERRAA